VPRASKGEELGTLLVLMHGVRGSHWAWAQKAGAHRTAQRLIESGEIKPLTIAMPSDGLWSQGSAYIARASEDAERWIVEDVPQAAKLAIPGLTKAPKVFLAGFSMGGYGALRIGSKYAGRFAGVSAHSSITNIERMKDFVDEPISEYTAQVSRQELNILYWMNRNRSILPPVRFDCGLEDKLLGDNRLLHTSLTESGIEHVYEEFPGGHTWPYWERHLEETLRFVSYIMRSRK
jgi:putative tributyrin esterase